LRAYKMPKEKISTYIILRKKTKWVIGALFLTNFNFWRTLQGAISACFGGGLLRPLYDTCTIHQRYLYDCQTYKYRTYIVEVSYNG
jgi:hypothetical protein